jgi:hypothetical protein
MNKTIDGPMRWNGPFLSDEDLKPSNAIAYKYCSQLHKYTQYFDVLINYELKNGGTMANDMGGCSRFTF